MVNVASLEKEINLNMVEEKTNKQAVEIINNEPIDIKTVNKFNISSKFINSL